MTIETTAISTTHPCNGVVVAFDTEFYFGLNSDLVVYIIDDDTGGPVEELTLDVDYTVSGRMNPAGGVVTLNSARPEGQSVKIDRVTAITMLTSLRSQTNYDPAAVEAALTKLTQIAQETDGAATQANALAAATAAIAAADSATAADASADAALASQTSATSSAAAAASSAAAAGLGPNIGYATKADMDADLAHDAGTLALVTNDPTTAYNITYRKTGASGSGSWVASADNRLAAVAENFVAKSLLNLADPNVADTSMSTFADQLHRLYSTGTGALSAQSPATLGSFAVTRHYDVTPGSTYTISMHGASPNWGFYFTGSPYLGFYNANGTFNQQQTSGFTDQNGTLPASGNATRSITFTVPAGCYKVAFNKRNTVDFSNTVPATTASLQSCAESIMLNVGATALDFTPYTAAGLDPDPDIFNLAESDPVTVAVQDRYAYFRSAAQMSDTYDVVLRALYAETPVYTAANVVGKTGTLDFCGARFIPKGTSAAGTIAAYNQSTMVAQSGTDERCPVRINGMYLGAGHGIIGYELTKTGHDKTTADIGSTWTDGAAAVWVLAAVPDANTVFFIRDNTGATDKWIIGSTVPNGSTLTHASGATHTGAYAFTASTQNQLHPILQNLSVTLWLDDVQLTADGVYTGTNFRIEDNWDIPNAARLLTYLKANVGTTDYTNSGIGLQVKVSNSHVFNIYGVPTLYRTEEDVEAFSRAGGSPGDYSGGIQLQRLARTIDTPANPGFMSTTVWLYVPDTAAIGGVDYKSIADISANGSFVLLPKSACTDTANPASHFAMLGKDGSSNVVVGMVWGYSRASGLGVPATRAAKVTVLGQFSSAEKMYPIAIDYGAGDAVAGDVHNITAFRGYFLPTDTALSIPAFVFTDGPKFYAIVVSHTAQARKWVALPKELVGKPVSVKKADANVTLLSDRVGNKGVLMTFAASYGDVVLEIG